LPFDIETYTAYTTTNVDFDTEILRYGYQSMATPSSVIDFNMRTKEKTVLKEQEVLEENLIKTIIPKNAFGLLLKMEPKYLFQ
jgi:protease II